MAKMDVYNLCQSFAKVEDWYLTRRSGSSIIEMNPASQYTLTLSVIHLSVEEASIIMRYLLIIINRPTLIVHKILHDMQS